jgi:hypothetical protein
MEMEGYMVPKDLYAALAGDGIHDDTEAIQALLNCGVSLVCLPVPQKEYLISKCLKIHSNTAFVLDRFSRIHLAPGSNCLMMENAEEKSENISIAGGIWDYDNLRQEPNPLAKPKKSFAETVQALGYTNEYLGVCMRFNNVKNFILTSATFRNPVTFAVQMANMYQFTVKDIIFDFEHWNPIPLNMDGIHLDGGCRFGHISNLQGTCYDDLVALNADDFLFGPIEDITVDGLYSIDCHSAVRLLSTGSPVRRIHITNVYGTYYEYCITLSKFYRDRPGFGLYDQIHISNCYAQKASRPRDLANRTYIAPFIWIDTGLKIGNLQFSQIHRREDNTAIPTIVIDKETDIEVLAVSHASQSNLTPDTMPFLKNSGKISVLHLNDVHVEKDVFVDNSGEIGKIFSEPKNEYLI